MRFLLAYGVVLVALILLDLIWLRYAGDAFFQPEVGPMLAEKPNFFAAGLFYLFFAAGLTYFAVTPALQTASVATVLVNGALLGFLGYMTFDFTNLAILKLWTVKISAIDISWGTFASAMAATAGYFAVTALKL